MMPRGRKPKKRSVRKRTSAAKKGWETRRRREKAIASARKFKQYHAPPDEEVEVADTNYPWDRQEGWEPPGGWQGDDLAEEISFMTHEEKVEYFEWLAEELDTTVHELFEMWGEKTP